MAMAETMLTLRRSYGNLIHVIHIDPCNTLNDLFHRICIPNKIEDLNLSVINMITVINESKTLTKHISFSDFV